MLSIKEKVNTIIYVETFIIKLANHVISQVSNHLIKGTGDVGLHTKAHLFITQINASRLYYYWSYSDNHAIEIFKNYFENIIFEN